MNEERQHLTLKDLTCTLSAITRKTQSTMAAVRSFTVDAIGFDTAVVCTVCTFVDIYR